MAAAYTRVVESRAPKVSDAFVDEYAATDSFDLQKTEQRVSGGPPTKEELESEMYKPNIDMPKGDVRQEVAEETWRCFCGWRRYFRVATDPETTQAARRMLSEAVGRLPREHRRFDEPAAQATHIR